MPATGIDENIASSHANWRKDLFDLLSEPMQARFGILRERSDFLVDEPWALASFGKVTLRRGWWTFECEGDGDVSGVELRLLSAEDTLVAFSLRRALKGCTFFQTDKTLDISLLASAWPGRVRLRTLQLRRLSRTEEAGLAVAMLSRLAKTDKPLSKIVHIASRVLAGRSLRIQSLASALSTGAPQERAVRVVATMRTVQQNGVTAVLYDDERLHPRATEIVANLFERLPLLQAAYSDRSEGGQIRPKPQWDPDLAAVAVYADSPVFFRGRVNVTDAWSRLKKLSEQAGTVARVALPLSIRDAVDSTPFMAPPVPRLPSTPLVSVVIPTKIRIDLLERCLEGLVDRTDYPALEVVIVNGCSDHPRFEEVIAQASTKLRLRRVDDAGSFNFSRLVNLGVRNSEGKVVLLLNDDVEAIETGWLHRIVESAIAPGVGCVGARLVYPDQTIQHAGMTLGISGVCGHLWKGLSRSEAALIPQVVLPSQRMAVTGACLAVRREIFDRVGGLDEINFPVAFNDVDFCLRVRALGYRTIYRGDAALIHHESQSRGLDDATMKSRKRLARETAAFLDRWRELLSDDPFGSPAFDPMLESGAIHPSLREEAVENSTSIAHRPRRGG